MPGVGENLLAFGPFQLDLARRSLTDAGRRIELSARALDLLALLIRERHRAVSRAELMAELWPNVVVEDGNLTVNISLLRKALHGGSGYIETLPRVGYRFTAELRDASAPREPRAGEAQEARLLVGRQRELARLDEAVEQVMARRRQTVFVSGEPGAGKTSLIEAFLERSARQRSPLAILRGRCIEHRGESEPYLPLLEGLGRLCACPSSGARLLQVLERVAPSWLMQLPRWADPARGGELERRVARPTACRMLRELADLVESFGNEQPLFICLEDLHWADPSTLDLVAHLARQVEPARCLLLASYRPAEGRVRARGASALSSLQLEGESFELALPQLLAPDVRQYLARRFRDDELAERFAPVIHERTRGNPLFMVQLADVLAEARSRSSGAADGVAAFGALLPATTAARIELEVDRLGHFERRVLDAGSVAGGEFSALVVAAALDADVTRVERLCQHWARQGRLLISRGEGTWPDGARGTSYDLIHALYRETLYGRLGAATRAQLHQRIAERLERGFAAQPRLVAAELGRHFGCGTEPRRAVPYLSMAGQTALARAAYREAASLFGRALGIVRKDETGPEGRAQVAELLTWIGSTAMAMHGFSSPVAARAFRRARRACEAISGQSGSSPTLSAALFGCWVGLVTRGRHPDALRTAQDVRDAATVAGAASGIADADLMLGYSHFYVGAFAESLSCLERARAVFAAGGSSNSPRTTDSLVMTISHTARVLVSLGLEDEARERARQGLERVRELGRFSRAPALHCASMVHLCLGEAAPALDLAEQLRRLSEAEGFVQYAALGLLCRGAARVSLSEAKAGLADLETGLARSLAASSRIGVQFWHLQIARARHQLGRGDEAKAALEAAVVWMERTHERWSALDLERAWRALERGSLGDPCWKHVGLGSAGAR